VQLPKRSREVRIAVRLRDQHGRYWLARPEPQGREPLTAFSHTSSNCPPM
jgi:hypothetical protein